MRQLGSPPDVRWLQERLDNHLWRDDELPGRVVGVRRIQRRRSRTGDIKSLYKVTLRQSDQRCVEQAYVGFEFPADALGAEYESWRLKATIVPPLGRAAFVIPEANLLLIAFPNNRQMRTFTGGDLVAWLGERASGLANRGRRGPRWQLADAEVHVMQCHPGHRLTLRCRGLFVAEDGTKQAFAYIAKQFRKHKRAKAVYQNLTSLSKLFNGSSGVRVPRAVAFDDEIGLLVMEELPGMEMESALPVLDLDRVMLAAGRTLAIFHQATRQVRKAISIRKNISREGELEKVCNAAKTIGGVVPGALEYVNVCVSRCGDVQWTDDAPSVVLHGSYRPKHLFVDEGVLGLIDIDGLTMGHPAYDLAEFLSSLYFLEAAELISTTARREAASQFLLGYGMHVPRLPSPTPVLWFLAAFLLHKHARKQAQCLDELREKKVCHLLIVAETALRGCEELRGEPSLEAIWRILP